MNIYRCLLPIPEALSLTCEFCAMPMVQRVLVVDELFPSSYQRFWACRTLQVSPERWMRGDTFHSLVRLGACEYSDIGGIVVEEPGSYLIEMTRSEKGHIARKLFEVPVGPFAANAASARVKSAIDTWEGAW